MPKFDSISSLISYLKISVSDSLQDECYKDIRKTEQKHIQSDVYDVYEPEYYVRRKESGGLIADSNIIGKLVSDDTLEVTNETKSDKGAEGLPEWIEYGFVTNIFNSKEGYPWTEPRPFTQNTIDELRETHQLTDTLMVALKKRGINTEKG